MLISGKDNQRLAFAGFDALFIGTAIIAVQLSYAGNLIAGMGMMAFFAQFRSVWSERMSRPGQEKWRKVLNVNLTWNDYFLIAIALIVFQLIFTGHVMAADPVSPEAGKGAATGMNKAWNTLFKNDGTPSFFGTLANTLRGLGIIALVLQGGKVLVKYASSDGEPSVKEFARTQIIERIIPNVIVIMLLANNGAGGGNLILTARTFIFSWDKVAYTAMKDVSDNLKQQVLIEDERKALEEVRGVFNTCISIPAKVGSELNPTFVQCLAEFKNRVIAVEAGGRIKNQATRGQLVKLNNELSKVAGGDVNFDFGQGLVNIGTLLTSAIGSGLKNGADEFVNGIVLSIGIAYNFCVEFALMLMGVSLPLVLMLSLYKFDVFLKWLPQLLNLFVAKITYTIVAGLVQYLRADAGSDLGVWGLAVIIGLGCPLVSIFTALALSGAMGTVFEREAVRGGAGAARMVGFAAGGVGAMAGKATQAIAKRM